MKPRSFSLPVLVLYLCGIALGIAGVVFLSETTSSHIADHQMRNAMTAGITCLSLASVFVILASIMAFVGAHLNRQPPHPPQP